MISFTCSSGASGLRSIAKSYGEPEDSEQAAGAAEEPASVAVDSRGNVLIRGAGEAAVEDEDEEEG